jgi:hypothetical protein
VIHAAAVSAAKAGAGGGSGGDGDVSISDTEVDTGNQYPNSATAGYRLNANGNVERTIDGSNWTIIDVWLNSGAAGDYQVRLTPTSGTFDTGTTGSWLTLSSTRPWTKSIVPGGGSGLESAEGTLEIRRVSNLVVLDTATLKLTAISFNPDIGGTD